MCVFQAVLAVECEMKESIYGFHGNRKIPFLRITMALPRLIAPAKRILETGFKFASFPEKGYSTYESNIDYEVSCRCDSIDYNYNDLLVSFMLGLKLLDLLDEN